MHYHYLLMALDHAREREDEAARERLAATARAGSPAVNPLRRVVARAAVAIARAADDTVVPSVATAH